MPEGRRRDLVVAAAIFAFALVLRALHFREVALHDPFYGLPTVDDFQYDAWAKRLVAGDGLVDGVLYLGPGYPIFMALVYALFGPSLAAVKAVQVGIGAATCVLVWAVTREVFDRRAAIVSGLIASCYAMLVFYGGTLMTVNLKLPLVLAMVLALTRAMRRPSFAGFVLAGTFLGLAVLVQQTALPFLGLALPWIVFGMRGDAPRARRVVWAAAFAAATLACIAPFTLHNWRSGGDFVLLNSMGGPNFYMGVAPNADGTWQVPDLGMAVRADNPDEMQRQFEQVAERAAGHALRTSEVSAYWMARGIEIVRDDPLRFLALTLRKLALHFNAYEVWNVRSFEVSRETSWVLRLPLVTLGAMAPLGLLGIALSGRRWRELAVLHGVSIVYLASSLVFFVLARYRLPGMVMLIPFAGMAIVRLYDAVRAREIALLAGALAAAAVFAGVVHLPLESSKGRMHMAYYNLANKYRELERWDEAIAAYERSLDELPGAPSTQNNLALTLELAGRREEAIRAWQAVYSTAVRTGDPLRRERATRHLAALRGARPPKSQPERGLARPTADP